MSIQLKLAQELASFTKPVDASKFVGIPTKVTDKLAQTRVNGLNFSMDVAGALPQRVNDFKQSLDASRMLVKSVKTGELKTVELSQDLKPVAPTSLDAYEIRDERIVPKQNYSKVDPDMLNIFAHKGPDEPKPSDDGIGGGAL